MKTIFKIPVLLLALMLVVSCGDSKKEEEKASTIINIEKPDGWFDMNTDNAMAKNLQRTTLNSEELLNDMKLKESNVLYFFTKYDPKNYSGISPTINATLLKNIYGHSLEDLKNQAESTMGQLRDAGMEEVFLKSSNIVNLKNGKKAVEIKSTFKLPGRPEKVISSIYSFFISKNWFIQLALSCTDNEDCDEVFNKVLENL